MRADAVLCRLESASVSAGVRSLSGALVDLEFDLGGRTFRPLAAPPWDGVPQFADAPPAAHLTVIGGEWPCVPFGLSAHDPVKHGHGTDSFWQLVGSDRRSVHLAIDYPEGHAVARLERTIALSETLPRVDLTLTIHARRAVRMPVGLHPILAFPASPGGLRITPAPHGEATTARAARAPAASALAPDQTIAADGITMLKNGGTTCVWDQPGPAGEDLVFLRDCAGWVEAADTDRGIATRIEWDAATLPHLLMWIANPGLSGEPRLKGFRGIGLEPVASYYDETHEGAEGVNIAPEAPVTIRHAIECRRVSAKVATR
ncbi:MAG TPA: hypothetical protein PLI43_04755 [Albidovulum sp.]|uniref:hypothetical protein n=1 Tax=Albidovulum sp. TaxID=1872424 RepID=UPI002B7F151E|nr:hypothetical protein [Albidovulum sp.]